MAETKSKPDILPAESLNRSPRRNLNRIHALPLPVQTYPIPAFHPTNPLSILYVLQTLLGPYIFPSSYQSHAARYTAYLSAATGNIVVTNPENIRALWERGFFGKGTLSRSEPEWLEKEKKRIAVNGPGLETSEEVTRLRREARREEKRQRARKEREEIEKQLKSEGKLLHLKEEITTEPKANGLIGSDDTHIKTDHITHEPLPPPKGHAEHHTNGIVKTVRFEDVSPSNVDKKMPNSGNSVQYTNGVIERVKTDITNQEHLQLTPEEAFFLVYGLGILEIVEQHTKQILLTNTILERFRRHSYFPPATPENLAPDDPFLVSYVVYHHFRSLGWIVRSGIKFAADWLLYYRGPAFSHAEFAVFILPSYTDPYWSATPERLQQTKTKETKNWWWLHAVNRVQGHVKKTPVLVYVEIPPPHVAASEDIGALLRSYKVHEFVLKRWTANRSRKGR